MYSKQITLPLQVILVAPDSWTAGFDGEKVVYTEHFEDATPELIAATVKAIQGLSDVEVTPTDDGVKMTFHTQPLQGMFTELLCQMVIRDLVPEPTMHQIIALLRAPQLPGMMGVGGRPGAPLMDPRN